jgi:hypothetical protein
LFSSVLTLSDYRPELARRKAEKEANAEAAKQANMERMLRDMGMGASKKDDKPAGDNPFGPHFRNDRADAYMDYEGGEEDDSEDERIERQMEEEEEADDAPELGSGDVEVEFGGKPSDVNWRAP